MAAKDDASSRDSKSAMQEAMSSSVIPGNSEVKEKSESSESEEDIVVGYNDENMTECETVPRISRPPICGM